MKLPLAFLTAALLFPLSARADDNASLAYQQAAEFQAAGKWEQACPLYEASYRADPQIGVLLHLAECHEHIGKLASAWAEYNDAAELARARHDGRDKGAQLRADALKPRLAHLHVNPLATPPPGVAVRRDGADITVLVGTDIPIDPGDHEIVATAPGFIDWHKKVTVPATSATTTVDIGPLDKVPEKPVEAPLPPPVVTPPQPRANMLAVFTQPGAQIEIDGKSVGTGHFEGPVTAGKHSVRVTAPGARPYLSDVVVAEGENRSLDVALERELGGGAGPSGPAENLPAFELGLGFAPGVKGHGDKPAIVAYRFDAGFRFGRRVNFGAFVEFAKISASGACGTDITGPQLSSPYDFGMHNQFNSCQYVMPGLQLYVHVLPKQQFDPWIGVTPGFRFAFYDITQYNALGQPSTHTGDMYPGILANVRAGVDYHPLEQLAGWAIGAFFDTQISFIADENFKDTNDKGKTYVSFFGGLRSALQF